MNPVATQSSRYPVQQLDWHHVTLPDYCVQLFHDFLTDPGRSYEEQSYHAEFKVPQPVSQSLTTYAETLLLYYRRAYARIHDLWLEHHRALDTMLQRPTGMFLTDAWHHLQTLVSPQHLEIILRRDLARAKEGDRLELDNFANTFAYYVHKRENELWITRYKGELGYELPAVAAPLFEAHDPYAFLEDHRAYEFRGVQRYTAIEE